MGPPPVYTYHCLCTSLLLATTHQLSSLPRRAPPALDQAIILPVPPVTSPTTEALALQNDENEEGAAETAKSTSAHENAVLELGSTILLSVIPDRRLTVVRREDGFEKRHLLRCGRCRLVVGYELDAEQFPEIHKSKDADLQNAGRNDSEKIKIIYLLPGGIMSTDIMAAGKKISEDAVRLGGASKNIVACWE